MAMTVTILEDQMFKRVFGRNKELCRRLIELALDVPIAHVEFLEAQHESKNVGRPGGTYFDVLATTGSGELIDVEMQADSRPGLLQRARLYEGRLTNEAWSRYIAEHDNYNYRNMPKVAVIFICNFDPLDGGARRYTGRMKYTGASSPADDGATIVLLNAKGSQGSISPDLAAFLDYVASGRFAPGASEFVDGVAREVAAASGEAGFREGLMDLNERLWWSRQDGIKEGRAEGESKGASDQKRRIAELARRMTADGRDGDLAAVLTDDARLEEELRRYGLA